MNVPEHGCVVVVQCKNGEAKVTHSEPALHTVRTAANLRLQFSNTDLPIQTRITAQDTLEYLVANTPREHWDALPLIKASHGFGIYRDLSTCINTLLERLESPSQFHDHEDDEPEREG